MIKASASFFLIFALSFTGFAWGPTGHRATGWVANKYLSKKARKAIHRILKGQSLAIASTWMDEVRSDSTYDYMTDWHWVTIPGDRNYEQSIKNPKGDIIQTLERVLNELKSKTLTEEEQAFRIKILSHLVGDIHQPLHVGAKDDNGGNGVKVMWFRTDSNLHRVWDSDIIDDTKLSFSELAESLASPSKAEIITWQRATVREWANESQAYHKQVYEIGNGRLGYRYSYVNYPTVRQRLLQAGVRLAKILNEIYG